MSSFRHRAHSNPASPSLSSSARLEPTYGSLVQQTLHTASDEQVSTFLTSQSPPPRTAALTEASLAALTLSEASDDRYRHPDHSFPRHEDYGYDRQAATPSTTSVSDEEEGEGYEEQKEDRAGPRTWSDRKGKGKAADHERDAVKAGGNGIAGRLPEEVLMNVSLSRPSLIQ
jgi:hypothetical protein